LTVPEIRRLLLALAGPPEQFNFHLAWSFWRRQQQAVAKRAHIARRARRPAALPPVPQATLPLPSRGRPDLTDDDWHRLRPLLPPQQPPRGRPNHDHRQMVAAMLWVERTGCSWRSLPAHFGAWHTVYCRFQRWRKAGLWAQILAVLDTPHGQLMAA